MTQYDALAQLAVIFAAFAVLYAIQRFLMRDHEPPREPKPMPQDDIDQIDKAW